MNFTDKLLGVALGSVVIIILIAIVFIAKKVEEKKFQELRASLSPEVLSVIDQAGFTPYKENPNFLACKGYIVEAVPEGERYKVKVFFHHEPTTYAKSGDRFSTVYVEQVTFNQMGLKPGIIVTTLHNSDPQYQYEAVKII